MSANKFIRYPSVASAPSLLQGSYSIGWHDDYPMDYLVRNSLEHTPSVLSAVGNIAVLACRLAPLGDFNRGSTQLSKAEYTVAISRPESGPDADEWDAAAQCILSLQQKAWAHNTPFQSFKRLCSGHQLPMYYPPFMSQSMNMLLFQRPLFKSLDYEGQNVNLFPLQADPSPRIGNSGLSRQTQNMILHEYGERRRLVDLPVYDTRKQKVSRWGLVDALEGRRVRVAFRLFHLGDSRGDHYMTLWDHVQILD